MEMSRSPAVIGGVILSKPSLEGQELYLKSTAQQDCSAEAYFSRLIFTAGLYSPSSPYLLSNISVISCATGYQVAQGELDLSWSSPRNPVARSFTRSGQPDNNRTTGWRVIESQMLGTVVFNPSVAWYTSDFGSVELVIYYAEKLAPADKMSAQVLIYAISRVFTSSYRMAVALYAFNNLQKLDTDSATVRTPVTRLFVITWVAYVILSFLVVVLISVGLVFWYVERTPTFLAEEPEGLMSAAGLLMGSELMELIPEIRQQYGYDGRTRKAAKENDMINGRLWRAQILSGQTLDARIISV